MSVLHEMIGDYQTWAGLTVEEQADTVNLALRETNHGARIVPVHPEQVESEFKVVVDGVPLEDQETGEALLFTSITAALDALAVGLDLETLPKKTFY